jgi:hypothetical protein
MTETKPEFTAFGGGPYDAEASAARKACGGGDTGIVLLVRNGKHGDGFEVQLGGADLRALPHVLRTLARQVEQAIGN